MVGQRWGTEERAAADEGGSTFLLLYLRLLPCPSYLHTYAYSKAVDTYLRLWLPYYMSFNFVNCIANVPLCSIYQLVSFPNWFLWYRCQFGDKNSCSIGRCYLTPMFLLFPKTFVQLFMRTSQVVPRALVLVVVVGEPLERGAGLGCKLVLAESGARRWLHCTSTSTSTSSLHWH